MIDNISKQFKLINGRRKLCEGWQWQPLSYLAKDTERRNPKLQFPGNSFKYIDIQSIDNELGKITKFQTLLTQEAPSRARKLIRTDDIIIATTRPYLRNIALVPPELNDAICSTGFCVLRADHALVLPKYIYYACLSDIVIEQLIPKQRGANYPAVSDHDIFESIIPLPCPDNSVSSLNIQRAIVTRIETLLDEVRESRKLLYEIQQKTNQMMGIVLEQVYRELELSQVPVKDLGSLLSKKPQYGTSKKAHENYLGTAILRMGNITNTGTISFNDLKYVELPPHEEEKYIIKEGDILFNRTNSAELVGKSAVFEGSHKAVFASYLIRLIPDKYKVNSKYLNSYINSNRGRAYVQSQLTRAIGMVNVNAKKLAAMPVPVPDIKVQEQVVAYVDTIQNEVNEILKILQQDAQSLDMIEKSILERAFIGEL
ncbi:MAG: restriction endonuclease subunit S [Gloeotrichia echinulata GP01]